MQYTKNTKSTPVPGAIAGIAAGGLGAGVVAVWKFSEHIDLRVNFGNGLIKQYRKWEKEKHKLAIKGY